MKLLNNEEKPFGTKAGLLNVKITLPLTKLKIVGSRLGSNGKIFSDHTTFDIQLVTFLL